jgi:hypothetical protein
MPRHFAVCPTLRSPAALRLLLLLLVAAASHGIAPAQATAQVPATVAPGEALWEVRLADGSTLLAMVEQVDANRLVLRTAGGTRVEVERAQIRSMRPASGRIVDGRHWPDDPNTTRLFFAPTGRSLPQGAGYFGVYELFIPFVSYGVTDRLTLSGGSPFYLGMFEEAPPVYIAPKLQLIAGEEVAVSIGTLALFVPGRWGWGDDDRIRTVGIAYGVGTWGGADNALTGGIGWGYAAGGFSARPVVMVGGETRVGRMTKLVTENWTVPGEDGLVFSGGVRFFGERLSADLGLAGIAASGSGGCCLPIVNFVYAFGAGH